MVIVLIIIKTTTKRIKYIYIYTYNDTYNMANMQGLLLGSTNVYFKETKKKKKTTERVTWGTRKLRCFIL